MLVTFTKNITLLCLLLICFCAADSETIDPCHLIVPENSSEGASIKLTPCLPNNWSQYFDRTAQQNKASAPLSFAIRFLQQQETLPGQAVDLGAGTGKDSLYLLKNDWHVLSIDYSKKAIGVIKNRAKFLGFNQPEVQVSDFSKMQLPADIDLINATDALPFAPSKEFPGIWANIVDHIKIGGLFVGNFYGPRDWRIDGSNKDVLSLTYPQLMCLFEKFEILYLQRKLGYTISLLHQDRVYQDEWDIVAMKNT